MAADANIFQQYLQPQRGVLDYMTDMDAADLRREQLQSAKQRNALESLTMQDTLEQRRVAAEDRNALRSLTAGAGSDENALIKALRGSGRLALMQQADAIEKGALERQKTQAEASEKTAKTAKEQYELEKVKRQEAIQRIGAFSNPQEAMASLQAATEVPAEQKAALMQSMPQDLAAFREWQLRLVLALATPEQQASRMAPSPDAVLSAETTRRGQDITDARGREKNQIVREAIGKVEWKMDPDGNWIALPKEIKAGGPVTPVTTTAPGKRAIQAGHALDIIEEARGLIDQGTGSYLGAGVDEAARLVGKSTQGAQAAAKLKALEGALMMAQPRMEGPQSDKDVALYRQMAAQIGDATVPAPTKRAALEAIEKLHQKYAPGGTAPAASSASRVVNFGDLK